MDHVDQLLELFDLSEQGDSPIRSLLRRPEEEDRAVLGAGGRGADPAARRALFRRPRSRRASDLEADHPASCQCRKDATIVLTSPVPELVEEIATRIIVLHDGEILAFDTARRPAAPDRPSRPAGPGPPAADLPRDDPEARSLLPGVRPMIRRVLSTGSGVVAPPGWPVDPVPGASSWPSRGRSSTSNGRSASRCPCRSDPDVVLLARGAILLGLDTAWSRFIRISAADYLALAQVDALDRATSPCPSGPSSWSREDILVGRRR